MHDRVLLDSNVLAYAFDSTDGRKQAIARTLVEDGLRQRMSFVVSLQNINEFFSIVTTKAHHGMSVRAAADAVDGFLAKIPCYCPDTRTVEYALALLKLYGIPYWDALIASVMLENSILTVYTENEKDFRKIPGIKVVNPFRK